MWKFQITKFYTYYITRNFPGIIKWYSILLCLWSLNQHKLSKFWFNFVLLMTIFPSRQKYFFWKNAREQGMCGDCLLVLLLWISYQSLVRTRLCFRRCVRIRFNFKYTNDLLKGKLWKMISRTANILSFINIFDVKNVVQSQIILQIEIYWDLNGKYFFFLTLRWNFLWQTF